MQSVFLAVDIGASSGRHILGSAQNGNIELREVYRFENKQEMRGGHACWNLDTLRENVLAGMKACAAAGCIPKTMGIDTWGVDYALLDEAGATVGDAVAYRDSRTAGMDAVAEKRMSAETLYARTGIQKQPFNTLYQLLAQKAEHPEQIAQASRLLMIPEYLNYCLTGKAVSEYTNATTTGLVNARTQTWDAELLRTYDLPQRLFAPLSMPGTPVGHLTEKVQQAVGFDCEVILPATHDTGSAFLAVPAQGEDAVYLSSGTWSLLGVENAAPITSEASRRANFTNEGGAWHRYRYLKNIMGLWMLQSIRRELNGVSYVAGKPGAEKTAPGKTWGFQDLIAAAAEAKDFSAVVDVDDPAFLAPDSMIEAVKAACAKKGGSVPQTVGEVVQCVYQSLAARYAAAVTELTALTGRPFTCLHIVGGGCQDQYLNQLTADATGLPVDAGPTEGTALGNLMVQMIAAKEFSGLAAARAAIRTSFPLKRYTPHGSVQP